MKEPGLVSRFYKQHPIEKIMTMSDAEVDALIDTYLDTYIERFQKRNPGKELPNIGATLAEVRNKRTNISKNPTIAGRKTYA